jgi:hypothetical protein
MIGNRIDDYSVLINGFEDIEGNFVLALNFQYNGNT